MRASRLSGLLLVLPLMGCLGSEPSPQLRETWARTPGLGEIGMTNEQKVAKDDGICRAYGALPGTPAYIQCCATQDQRRNAVLLSDAGAPAPVVNNIPVPGSDAPVIRNTLPQQTRCQSMRVGNSVQTVCN
jgi:hypothetical protein